MGCRYRGLRFLRRFRIVLLQNSFLLFKRFMIKVCFLINSLLNKKSHQYIFTHSTAICTAHNCTKDKSLRHFLPLLPWKLSLLAALFGPGFWLGYPLQTISEKPKKYPEGGKCPAEGGNFTRKNTWTSPKRAPFLHQVVLPGMNENPKLREGWWCVGEPCVLYISTNVLFRTWWTWILKNVKSMTAWEVFPFNQAVETFQGIFWIQIS